MQRLQEVLDNTYDNHIMPFLWIHGEDEATLREGVRRIHESGIGAVCVEARPHDDFNGPRWFFDLGIILDECKLLGMKMWLLDDSHFPTGFANGEVKRSHPELCKKYLHLKSYDFAGPVASSGACLKYALKSDTDQILGVYLQASEGFERPDVERTIDVTSTLAWYADRMTGTPNLDFMGNVMPGTQGEVPYVSFDVPEGDWTINILTVSYKGGEKETEGYLNPIIAEATDVLLNTVYQPVWDHFSADFGKTFQGFFSDEPRFGNIHGAEAASIGRNSAMPLPWRDDMVELLATRCSELGGVLSDITAEHLLPLLPLLFVGDGELAHALRFAYMDLVSTLYSDNFDGRIAEWCHEHNCRHIGHTIEDNGAAARLGYGAGHIFRAMAHADMAGIDVVIHQLMPGQDKGLKKGMHSPGWDGEFFTYLLGSFGGSLAHLNPAAHGQCMCELFGAFGWAEGNRLAKWLVDYMLVRGVNVLVPHAFNCKAFPDPDCPPHFCPENPQYPGFRLLMDYANRLCHLLTGGVACPDVLVYFNAEGEWSGEWMPTQKPAAQLARGLVSYDLVSADFLAAAEVVDGRIVVNGMSVAALVVPWAEALPSSLLTNIARIAHAGAPVLFVDDLPGRSTEGDTAGASALADLVKSASVGVVGPNELVGTLRDRGLVALSSSVEAPYLRAYHYRLTDGDVYLFTNEGAGGRITCDIAGAREGAAYVVDGFAGTVVADDAAFSLDVPAYGSKVVVVPDEPLSAPCAVPFVARDRIDLGACTVTLEPSYACGPDKGFELVLDAPAYVSAQPGFETWAGCATYRFEVDLDEATAVRAARIVVEGAFEGVSVRVNGLDCGTRICGDYVFAVLGLRGGVNTIEVEATTTLGRALNDFLSSFVPLEPTGVCGVALELG